MRRRRGLLAVVSGLMIALVVMLAIRTFGTDDEPSPAAPTLAEIRQAKARQKAREEHGIDRLLDYSTFIKVGGGHKRQVALTFDDGPGPFTGEILHILRKTKTPATFFVVGSMIPGMEKTIRKIMREGHAIGNHTQDHARMGDLDATTQVAQLIGQADLMEGAGAPAERLFRPPYRSFNGTTLEMLAERRMLMVLWSIDTNDYEGLGAGEIAKRTLAEVEPGSIILMHDGGGDRTETVKALPDILRGLKRRNLKPVTVPRLVLDDPPPRGEPLPDGLAGS